MPGAFLLIQLFGEYNRGGDDFWRDGGGDGCDAFRDYTINGDELKMTAYNYTLPPLPEDNGHCQIYTLVKENFSQVIEIRVILIYKTPTQSSQMM